MLYKAMASAPALLCGMPSAIAFVGSKDTNPKTLKERNGSCQVNRYEAALGEGCGGEVGGGAVALIKPGS